MNAVRRWWHQSDHFDWLTLYLHARGLRLIWRAMIASAPLSAKFRPAERALIDDLVNLADTAMYDAKHAGGNQSRSTSIAQADHNHSSA